MSLFPAYFGARKRADEDSGSGDGAGERIARRYLQSHSAARGRKIRAAGQDPKSPKVETAPANAEGRNVHAVNAMDLTRLSIDNDGRLYWDGKPVEVRRRLMMSRAPGDRRRA